MKSNLFKPQTDRFWGNFGVMKRKKGDKESPIEKNVDRKKIEKKKDRLRVSVRQKQLARNRGKICINETN